jgi:hypothetical protein
MARRAWWLGVLVLGVIVAGCGKLSLPWQKGAPQPTKVAPEGTVEPRRDAYRTLLPSGPVQGLATFDDGTPTQTEAIIPGQETLVALQGGVPYVTWHLRPDGVYRRDTKSGALLRYLPAELVDGLSWTQEDGDQRYWFLLTACPDQECWELELLTRNLVQKFTWAPGKWITKAESTDLLNAKNSFHKVMQGTLEPTKQSVAPEVWAEARVLPVLASDPQQFRAEKTRRLGSSTTRP